MIISTLYLDSATLLDSALQNRPNTHQTGKHNKLDPLIDCVVLLDSAKIWLAKRKKRNKLDYSVDPKYARLSRWKHE